mmetsp:Transcript_44155/g.68807  ORF Transcript_44155/g.68807 Transcript_44155/m.68807 type:complete len:277 (+) Transcript_44155:40-870(+)
MDKVVALLASLAFAQGRRVQVDLVPPALQTASRVSVHNHRVSPPVAQVGGSVGFGSSLAPASSDWDLNAISAQGGNVERIEGQTRKTWSFPDISKDRALVSVGSEGRPVHVDIDLWIGPDWTPFKLNAYSEDGKLRPIQTLVGTRNKPANIDIVNTGPYEMAINAGAVYAQGAMTEVAQRPKGQICQGSSIRSYEISPTTKQLEVCLRTDGKQLNAKVELLNSPNNPKQTYEVFTNNGELSSLCMCFNTPDVGTTVRVHNLATVEFPCYINLVEVS